MKQKKSNILEHIASISADFGLYPAELFNALVSAKEKGKDVCGDLVIEHRGVVDEAAIFSIKKKDSIVAQLQVPEGLLLEKNPFDRWVSSDRIERQIAKQNPVAPGYRRISDLRSGMKNVDLEAQVVEIEEPRLVHTQFGNDVMLANAWISDTQSKAGKIKVCLWDKLVNCVAKGDIVQISNASVVTFRTEKQLRLGKNSVIKVVKNVGTGKAKQNAECAQDGKQHLSCPT